MTKIANRNSITELLDHKLTLLELFYKHRGGAFEQHLHNIFDPEQRWSLWCVWCFAELP